MGFTYACRRRERIIEKEGGCSADGEGEDRVMGESGRKRCRGDMRRMRMNVGSYFECRGNGSRLEGAREVCSLGSSVGSFG